MERLLTVPEVAEILGVSRFTVWRWVLAGDLPSHKIGRIRRVAPGDLNALIAAGRQEGGRAARRPNRNR